MISIAMICVRSLVERGDVVQQIASLELNYTSSATFIVQLGMRFNKEVVYNCLPTLFGELFTWHMRNMSNSCAEELKDWVKRNQTEVEQRCAALGENLQFWFQWY